MPIESASITPVSDDETVFRAIADESQLFAIDAAGNLRLSGSAFNDRRKEPSVDRASMVEGAIASRKSESDGVVCLVTGEVRSVKSVVTLDAKQRPICEHQVDVVHDPVENNSAHSVVRTAPTAASESAFRRLKEALCLLANKAGWMYPPASRRPPSASLR